MRYTDVKAMMEEIGLQFAYYFFEEDSAPGLPFCVFYFPGERTEPADNTVHAKISTLNIELYTKNKDFDTEADLEAVLARHDLPFIKTETYLSDEHCYEVLYEMEVVIDG